MSTPSYTPRATTVFYLIAVALAWVVTLPLWLMESGMNSLLATPILMLMMFTPTIAAIIVSRTMHGLAWKQLPPWLAFTPLKPYKRLFTWLVIALVTGMLIPVLATFLAAGLGWFQLDLVEFSAFREVLQQASPGADANDLPVKVLVVVQLATMPLAALFNSVLAAGEEIGWRGYLLPALLRYGTWPALIISGALWGLWHAPIILLGYNFGRTDWTGVALMTAGCVFLGVFVGWIRLLSHTVWPAALFHGAINASAGTFALLGAADQEPDLAYINPLGYVGWITITIMMFLLVPAILRYYRNPQSAAATNAPAPATPKNAGS